MNIIGDISGNFKNLPEYLSELSLGFWYEYNQRTLTECYEVDIDTSRAKILTGLHYPSLTIYHQEYID